ncbi:MAG: type II toxin-antitoxin system HicB family antitoxin [Rubrimonas sp.]|uniref:type II toxin-antitoxin system HicB family antitoxin n=1 Tax=Rubrimonas sp. TaxID=2036015 RepID=UPI002FDD0145
MKPYKGYTGTVEFDEEDRVFHGRVVGVRDIVTFEARTADELVAAFRDSVDDYLAFHEERGTAPDRPLSGAISLRITPELHKAVVDAAGSRAKSVNQWIADALDEAARREQARTDTTVKTS